MLFYFKQTLVYDCIIDFFGRICANDESNVYKVLITFFSGISIVRYDFSEPQAGKSYCDAKIAHMRSKLRMFVSSGENVTTPFDMKKAIMDGSGVAGCQCAVVEVDRKTRQRRVIASRESPILIILPLKEMISLPGTVLVLVLVSR